MQFKNLALATSTTFFLVVSTATSAMISTDPFIKQWKYFDGINTYLLNIKASPAPGQNYHIDYTFPGGNSATDMCKIISNVAFNCISGETVKRDDASHSVKLTSSLGSYTFYDPSFMPTGDALLGKWQMKGKSDAAKWVISIMKGNKENEYSVLTSYSDSRGNHCSYGQPNSYKVKQNPDGTEVLSYDRYSFKYDPKKQQITNPKPGSDFVAGQCIQLMDMGQILFTKQ